VVDFGCGDFRLSRAFQGQASELYGIDNWLASNYHRASPPGARFYYASVDKAPFSTGSFDTVICTEVLEHVDSPEAVLQECFRVLRGGGHLVLSIPFNFFVHGAPNDYRRYTIYGLERLVRAQGLELVEYSFVGNSFYALLNGLVTWMGFRKGNRVGRALGSTVVACANIVGLLGLRLSGKSDLRRDTSAAINDRTNPLGYVLAATKPGQDDGVPKVESEIVVCPDCHGSLDFHPDEIVCTSCHHAFRYYDGVPVLADRETLHLEHEATGEAVVF